MAAALFAAAVVELLLRDEGRLELQLAVSALLCGALAARRSGLFLAIAVQACGFFVLSAAGEEPAATGAIIPLLICLFTAGSDLRTRTSAIALAIVVAAVFVQSLAQEDTGDAVYVTLVFVIPPWMAGRLMGTRRRQVAELERLNRELALERERADALAAEAERGRIAREMHDVLSHGMSLMVLQAGAGPRLLASDPATARASFRSIRQTGERAREELQAALTGEVGTDRDLESLVAAVPGASLRTDGELAVLAPGVRLAVLRIVQEGLTNAVKHGGGHVSVEVACDDGAVELAIRDRGDGERTAVAGSGRGLIGMRERAAAYGGTLQAQPAEPGGFEVRARIPAHPA
jgi:signal transduction histidine kinase